MVFNWGLYGEIQFREGFWKWGRDHVMELANFVRRIARLALKRTTACWRGRGGRYDRV